jgi:hypothetical protein
MKPKMPFLALAVLTAFAPAMAHAQQPAPTPITGVWRGQMEGLPGVTLVVTDENGSLQGAILFYFHQRKSPTDPVTVSPGLPEPIFNPRFDGKTLLFQVSHRRAHPPRSLSDPPVTIHLALTGPNQAELFNQEDRKLVITMIRTEY